jgi:uncharacterized protein YndB with AHSA1/START domain
MTPKIEHATIVVERRYDATPARVFRCWSDPALRAQWDLPGEGWELVDLAQDFRVGGHETSTFGPKGGPHYHSDGRYLDIVPGERFISAGTMFAGDTRLTTSLCTIEVRPDGEGCHLTLTDQSAFLGTGETPADRRAGWETILKGLGDFLARSRAEA